MVFFLSEMLLSQLRHCSHSSEDTSTTQSLFSALGGFVYVHRIITVLFEKLSPENIVALYNFENLASLESRQVIHTSLVEIAALMHIVVPRHLVCPEEEGSVQPYRKCAGSQNVKSL